MTSSAGDIAQTDLYTVAPTMRLDELERELTRRQISGAPVIDDGHLIGIVSRADVLRQLGLEQSLVNVVVDYYRQLEGVVKGLPPSASSLERADSQLGGRLRALTVRDAMSHTPISVERDASLVEVARTMVDERIHRVLVTDGQRLVGLISSLDLLAVVAQGRT